MAPRPSSPTISYLPAFVTVSIFKQAPVSTGGFAKIPQFTRANYTASGGRRAELLNLSIFLTDVLSRICPPTPGRPILHSTHRNFHRSTLLGYQCFALDTWLVGLPGMNSGNTAARSRI